MKEFKDKQGRLAVLISQHQANKLDEYTPDKTIRKVRKEICSLIDDMPFSDKRLTCRGMLADVHEIVAKNISKREERKSKQIRR